MLPFLDQTQACCFRVLRHRWLHRIPALVPIVLVATISQLVNTQLLGAMPHECPNILFILADDLGYGDVGCYGVEDIRTPHLDQLAADGLRFTNFYANGAVCSPTRIGFLTGRYQQRVGMDNALYYQEMGRGLPIGGKTIADALRSAGYATGISGKWHAGYDHARQPLQQGFSHFFGLLGGNHHYFEHRDRIGVPDLWLDNEPIQRTGYTTQLITEDGVTFIKQNRQRPFFLYLAHAAPHFPWQGPGDVDKVIRPKTKSWQQGDRATYAAMVEYMDAGIGRVLKTLDDLGLREKTLVVFTSDNGGHTYSRNAPLRGSKAEIWEGGTRVPCIARWPNRLPAGKITDQVGITMDWTATFRRLAGLEADPNGEDGIDLVPILNGQKPNEERTLFWRRKKGPTRKSVEEGRAVRQGRWKLVEQAADDEHFLFDLEADPAESTNRIAQQPQIAQALHQQLDAWEDSLVSKTDLRIAPFQCDVTPPLGHWLYANPLKTVEHPLLAKGMLLEQAGHRFVLCAIDWCVLSNGSHARLRRAMAEAAGTDVSNVTIQCTHVHTSVIIDSDAKALLAEVEDPPAYYDPAFLDSVADKLAKSVHAAVGRLEPCDRIGSSQAKVERVASNRRMMVDGKIHWRGSSGGRNPSLAKLPEGQIDPFVKTITFAHEDHPIVRLHYYATHPQSFYRDARATYDFVGMAREKLQEEEGVFQVYFTGCSGDVAAGKYNDGSPEARQGLYERLLAGMRASAAATKYEPVAAIVWRTVEITLPAKSVPGYNEPLFRKEMVEPSKGASRRIWAARRVAFFQRTLPITVSSLQMGDLHILHMPGEPMLEFQQFAQRQQPDAFVAVAGYGDGCTTYICTDQAFDEGSYEPGAAAVGRGSEKILKAAIRQLLGRD